MVALRPLLSSLAFAALARAGVTVYNQVGQAVIATGTNTAAVAGSTLAAYDTLVLNPPPLPNPLPATSFFQQLAQNAKDVPGLSIPLNGNFYGFSIEMSVVTQVIGLNGSYIHPEFLNLMSVVAARTGSVYIRIGGNTQEEATWVESLDDGKAIEKNKVNTNNPTQTPALLYTSEILHMLSNISALVPVKWYLGVPMNDTSQLRLQIAQYGQQILGDNLLGLQVGNEPDLYARHQHRPSTYGPYDFFGEFGDVVKAMKAQNLGTDTKLIGPSLATGDWTPQMMWETNFHTTYHDNLYALTMEHYPDDNCAAFYSGFGEPKDPQVEFANYLNHNMGVNTVAQYLGSTALAQQVGKPFIMFETNSASCGGYAGISTSFGATLWALDYGLTMAASNFSHALLHVGGQNVYYNPFTAIPTNESAYHDWTVGPIFYSVLAVGETLGTTGTAQIIDLWPNSKSIYTPGYAIYEKGQLARMALFNYMTDPTGAAAYTISVAIGGGTTGQPAGTPATLRVKYLKADSVGTKYNITWGGQTMGGMKAADGRIKGEEALETITCNTDNTCNIRVPAPGFALVYFSDGARIESAPDTAATFATSAVTKYKNTATIDEAVLATSNGNKGMSGMYGSTSFGSNDAPRAVAGAGALALAAAGAVVLRAFL
ncbi:uncharacterized protein BXZ73DRAFT_81751 [Epithele typhae]|uniref:uncharacterized protein n=1 Tax=Epithele typhae TaxID=378194 RepID=UPI00200861A5|nr:uncharacterized protein BXZ73DRAFT_81751 [Epithele typhae]KAH9914075.1 hypothetical protein BXZ73DRAFT_81751 [Epithele typhae]